MDLGNWPSQTGPRQLTVEPNAANVRGDVADQRVSGRHGNKHLQKQPTGKQRMVVVLHGLS